MCPSEPTREGVAASVRARQTMERAYNLADDKRLASGEVFYAVSEARRALLDLLAENEVGQMPHKCSNPECGTIEYGIGYLACPGCGGKEGRADV